MTKSGLRLLALFFCCLTTLGCQEALIKGLAENRAQKMFLTLLHYGIDAKRVIEKEGTWTLKVDSQEVPTAYQILKQNFLLEAKTNINDPKLNLLAATDERIRYQQRQLEAELEDTLSSIPGVLDARVHIAPEYKKQTEQQRSSASIVLFIKQEFNVGTNQIKKLVSGATSLNPKQVRVIYSRAEPALNSSASERDRDSQFSFPSKHKNRQLVISWQIAFVIAGLLSSLIGASLLVISKIKQQ
jgi:type III secretion protein J